ncbi:5'/3'-nucleotidase SurE [Permianibacter aggregans]|uniref:5'-nucleotidase SurE n=1 Tax=Permianibacter aggregans TaxID=1510150 RepID=A0A4R6UX90_9GAMM|nr:5'/3'-nucleotidase SurE [Permianibacter aggregans]QGX38813.1 5'/3'-nucleotidase SurE [Permianibacter aggregans]TDQ50619.1 5'-nucleotidase /3'-nucleotidase /exopolyphosphatase [Permianibacter aggregans]
MRILLSNDDGYFAPGLKALHDALRELGEVTVVAPDRNRSGASNSLTLDTPIRYHLSVEGFFAVTGTPTDCVHLATHRLMPKPPDIVLAGINNGANLGDDVIYSGTVAAAMEGRHLGYPALAMSLVGPKCEHYETAAKVALKLVKQLKSRSLAHNRILNVNVPDLPYDQLAGIKVTRLGHRHRADTIIPAHDPKGRDVYWIGPPAEGDDAGEGTDFHAIENGCVSVTPLHVDLTAYSSMDKLNDWIGAMSLP